VRCGRGTAGTVTTGRIEERSPRAGHRCDNGEEVRGAAVSGHHGHERTGARLPRGGALRRVPGRAGRRGRARPARPREQRRRGAPRHVHGSRDKARPARRSRRGQGRGGASGLRPGRSPVRPARSGQEGGRGGDEGRPAGPGCRGEERRLGARLAARRR